VGDLFDRWEEKMENMTLGVDFCEKNRRAVVVLRKQIRCTCIMATAVARTEVYGASVKGLC